jgi:SpoVK/Ycf46/Vps4 family AAA+-type ATPase
MAFFNVSIADILSKWVGESERLVKELFRQAKEHAPAIIFFDEIEALFTTRGLLDTSGVHKNIISQILAEMDGIIALKNVFVIGATNRPDLLDPALLRPGRFDEIIEIPRPDRRAAACIVRIYLKETFPVAKEIRDRCGGQKKGIQFLQEYLLDELYGETKWIEVKLDPEAKQGVKTVKRKDIVSGALIRAIITTAKKSYVKRVMGLTERKRREDGLRIEDFDAAIQEETKEHALTEYATFERRQKEIFKKIGSDPMVL